MTQRQHFLFVLWDSSLFPRERAQKAADNLHEITFLDSTINGSNKKLVTFNYTKSEVIIV